MEKLRKHFSSKLRDVSTFSCNYESKYGWLLIQKDELDKIGHVRAQPEELGKYARLLYLSFNHRISYEFKLSAQKCVLLLGAILVPSFPVWRKRGDRARA